MLYPNCTRNHAINYTNLSTPMIHLVFKSGQFYSFAEKIQAVLIVSKNASMSNLHIMKCAMLFFIP
jgi:hypothetical protein